MSILSSASKIAFLILTIALCVFTWRGQVDPKDFFAIVLMTFGYYFNKNTNNPPPQDPTQEPISKE